MKNRAFRIFAMGLLAAGALTGGGAGFLLGLCGPFTDVTDPMFCPFVLEIFYLGITTGTTATTYDPSSSVSRLQMAAFLSRTVDGVLKRGSRRALLGQFWPGPPDGSLPLKALGNDLNLVAFDGEDVWVAGSPLIYRVHATTGVLLDTATFNSALSTMTAFGVLPAMGHIWITGRNLGAAVLGRIDFFPAPGLNDTTDPLLGSNPRGITFDGSHLWLASTAGSVSFFSPGLTGSPVGGPISMVTTGFSQPAGALYDGANVWVTDQDAGKLLKLSAAGSILQTVTVGTEPQYPVFDGNNIWVPNYLSGSVSVVRASSGALLANVTGNGLATFGPVTAAFDGQRILITNFLANTVSLFKAADFSPLGAFSTGPGTGPLGACSDGINFWITLNTTGQLARF